MSTTQYADPDTSLEVDTMILDYFLYSATKSIIGERVMERNGQDPFSDCKSWLEMTEGFIHLFKTNHPNEVIPDALQIRWNLFNFTNLFFRRFKKSGYLPSPETLEAQRHENSSRAHDWLRRNSFLQVPSSTLEGVRDSTSQLSDNYRDMCSHMRLPSGGRPDRKNSVALLDIIPAYMLLCDLVPLELKGGWMRTAIRFMMHAALEQILIYGNAEIDMIHEAFAWGLEHDEQAMADNHRDAWTEERDSAKASILPDGGSWNDQLGRIMLEKPLFAFEGDVIELSNGVLQATPSPLLSQLETGDITLPFIDRKLERLDREDGKGYS